MHVVFVCAEYPYINKPTGGFGAYVERMTSALVNKYIDVTVICLGKEKQVLKKGKKVIHVLPKFFPGEAFQRFGLLSRIIDFLNFPILFSIEATLEIIKINKKQKIYIVEGGDFAGELFFYILLRKIISLPKCVVKLHTPSFILRKFNEEKLTFFYRVLSVLEIFCIRHADGLNSPTKDLAQNVSRDTGVSITDVIPYPIDYLPEKKIKKLTNKIIYVGKMQTKKGIFVLLKALPLVLLHIPKAHITFIGPDTTENGQSVVVQLKKLINKSHLQKNTSVISEIDQLNLYAEYRSASMIVIPSLWENFPNVLLEAGMLGCAIVASSVGGIPEIVSHRKNGLLSTLNDDKNLADTMIEALKSSQLRNTLVKNMKENLKHRFRPEKVAKLTITFYEKILAKK